MSGRTAEARVSLTRGVTKTPVPPARNAMAMAASAR